MEREPDMNVNLVEKIEKRTARIGVVGLGYVGLPLAVAFAEHGFTVWGIDTDPVKVAALLEGTSYVGDLPSERLSPLVPEQLMPTTDYGVLSDCDAVIICVPTPLSKTKDPDMSYIVAAAEEVRDHVHRGMLIVLESTTYPGTTEEVILPRLARQDLVVGRDFFLAFSPERTDPGRSDYTVETTPKVIGGVTRACRQVASTLYAQVIQQLVPVTSTRAAEMVKLLENTFRAVNIALVNEMAIMCDKLDLDVWEVIEAAGTKPYGFMKFTPGPGVGGHCIPLDPYYLSWKLRTLNYNARFVQLAGEINSDMPRYWVVKVQDALNACSRPLMGSRILLLGVTYKRDVGDIRESPALDIIELLHAKGSDVRYHDPYVPRLRYNSIDLCREPDLELALAEADCVMIVTDHSLYDWPHIAEVCPVIVDTRHRVWNLGASSGKEKA